MVGNVKRYDEGHVLRRMSDAPCSIKKETEGRPKQDGIHMESVGLEEEDVLDRTKWKNDIHNHSGDPRKARGEEEEKKMKVLEQYWITAPKEPISWDAYEQYI